jgi:hypothetical protein
MNNRFFVVKWWKFAKNKILAKNRKYSQQVIGNLLSLNIWDFFFQRLKSEEKKNNLPYFLKSSGAFAHVLLLPGNSSKQQQIRFCHMILAQRRQQLTQ